MLSYSPVIKIESVTVASVKTDLTNFQSHGDHHLGTSQDSGEGGAGTSSDNQGILNTMTSRVKLNFKVLGVQVRSV